MNQEHRDALAPRETCQGRSELRFDPGILVCRAVVESSCSSRAGAALTNSIEKRHGTVETRQSSPVLPRPTQGFCSGVPPSFKSVRRDEGAPQAGLNRENELPETRVVTVFQVTPFRTPSAAVLLTKTIGGHSQATGSRKFLFDATAS